MTRKQHIEYLIYGKVLRKDDLNSASLTASWNLKAFHKWSQRGFTSQVGGSRRIIEETLHFVTEQA